MRTVQPADWAETRVVIALGFGVTLLLGLFSNGVHHDDDLTHFLMARWAWRFPDYLLHSWGRPGFTLPAAAVAWIGSEQLAWHLCRVLSAAVTAAGVWFAARMAERMGVRRTWLVAMLGYLQPMNSLLACTTLTENFAAFYLIAAVYFLYAERPILSATVFSAALVTRHELVVLIPFWWMGLLVTHASLGRRFAAILASLWAPALHNLLFFQRFGAWPLNMFAMPAGSTQYLPAGPLTYLPSALYAMTPAIFALGLLGMGRLWGRGWRLIPAMTLVFFLTHATLVALGVYASGGFPRFMVTVAPMIAILAAAGLEDMLRVHQADRVLAPAWKTMAFVWILGLAAIEIERWAGRFTWPTERWRWAAIGTVALLVLMIATLIRRAHRSGARRLAKLLGVALVLSWAIQYFVIVKPLRLRPRQLQVRRICEWLNTPEMVGRKLFSTDPWVSYFLGLIEDPVAHKGPTLLAAMPVGTVVLWDPTYCPSDFHQLPWTLFADSGDYAQRALPAEIDSAGAAIHIFEKVRHTSPPEAPDRPYPPVLMRPSGPPPETWYIRP